MDTAQPAYRLDWLSRSDNIIKQKMHGTFQAMRANKSVVAGIRR